MNLVDLFGNKDNGFALELHHNDFLILYPDQTGVSNFQEKSLTPHVFKIVKNAAERDIIYCKGYHSLRSSIILRKERRGFLLRICEY